MGIEWIRKIAPRYRKGLDRRRVELGTPGLFTQNPASTPRAYAASLCEGHTLRPGETVGIHLDGENVLALRGLTHVATFRNPNLSLKNALAKSHGEASGTVERSYELARVVEIAVC